MKNKYIFYFWDNLKTLLIALTIAIIIRSFFFQPFYIPSSSMEPTLLIGDRIFVSKYSYGFSKHSFPFSPPILKKRILSQKPNYGDLVVFKTPKDNRTDYIKRLIGKPGDTIQFIDGDLIINNQKIKKEKIELTSAVRCGISDFSVNAYIETLENGFSYIAVYNSKGTIQNTDLYEVPRDHYFFLGDNRDCSKDSRYLSSVGYVNNINLVGKANFIFFSNDTVKGRLLKFWTLNKSFRTSRIFKKL